MNSVMEGTFSATFNNSFGMQLNQGHHLSAFYFVSSVLNNTYELSASTENFLAGVSFIHRFVELRHIPDMYGFSRSDIVDRPIATVLNQTQVNIQLSFSVILNQYCYNIFLLQF